MTALAALLLLCGPSAAHLAPYVELASIMHAVPASLLVAVAAKESRCRGGTGPRGSVGVWQVKPDGSAAYRCGFAHRPGLLRLPVVSAHCAAKHLAYLRGKCKRGGWVAALNMYSGNYKRCTPRASRYARRTMDLWRKVSR